MSPTYFSGSTLDDLLRHAIQEILAHGFPIAPTKGAAKELVGVFLNLTNPRARVSRTETRGKPYSCLGELCWYLARTNSLQFIQYYLPAYRVYADDGLIHGGYGPRLFEWRMLNQFESITNLLRREPLLAACGHTTFRCTRPYRPAQRHSLYVHAAILAAGQPALHDDQYAFQ